MRTSCGTAPSTSIARTHDASSVWELGTPKRLRCHLVRPPDTTATGGAVTRRVRHSAHLLALPAAASLSAPSDLSGVFGLLGFVRLW